MKWVESNSHLRINKYDIPDNIIPSMIEIYICGI